MLILISVILIYVSGCSRLWIFIGYYCYGLQLKQLCSAEQIRSTELSIDFALMLNWTDEACEGDLAAGLHFYPC